MRITPYVAKADNAYDRPSFAAHANVCQAEYQTIGEWQKKNKALLVTDKPKGYESAPAGMKMYRTEAGQYFAVAD